MREIEVKIPGEVDGAVIERAVEQVIAELGLQVRLLGSLANIPGSVHWHLKQGRQRGTLEVTFAPRERRLWLSVHAGRDGDWIDAMLHLMPSRIVAAIGQAQSSTG